jgi:hypothetical protein
LADKNRLDAGTNGVSTKLNFSLVVNFIALNRHQVKFIEYEKLVKQSTNDPKF